MAGSRMFDEGFGDRGGPDRKVPQQAEPWASLSRTNVDEGPAGHGWENERRIEVSKLVRVILISADGAKKLGLHNAAVQLISAAYEAFDEGNVL